MNISPSLYKIIEMSSFFFPKLVEIIDNNKKLIIIFEEDYPCCGDDFDQLVEEDMHHQLVLKSQVLLIYGNHDAFRAKKETKTKNLRLYDVT